jgi:hypothetical protein
MRAAEDLGVQGHASLHPTELHVGGHVPREDHGQVACHESQRQRGLVVVRPGLQGSRRRVEHDGARIGCTQHVPGHQGLHPCAALPERTDRLRQPSIRPPTAGEVQHADRHTGSEDLAYAPCVVAVPVRQ